MYIVEYMIIQALLIIWLVYTIKNPQKKESTYSYRVFIGNLGIIILANVVAIWFVVNKQSFADVIWESITK
jgi:hypothetical protein